MVIFFKPDTDMAILEKLGCRYAISPRFFLDVNV